MTRVAERRDRVAGGRPPVLAVDPLGRVMRPRCGKPVVNGIYWGEQTCGQPAGHPGWCLSVEAYKRYLVAQRDLSAAWYAKHREERLARRRAGYAARAAERDRAARAVRAGYGRGSRG